MIGNGTLCKHWGGELITYFIDLTLSSPVVIEKYRPLHDVETNLYNNFKFGS